MQIGSNKLIFPNPFSHHLWSAMHTQAVPPVFRVLTGVTSQKPGKAPVAKEKQIC